MQRQTRERRTQFRQRRPSNYSASITMPCPHVTGDFIVDPSRLPLALALASITQAVKHCQAHLSSGAIMIKIWRREPRLSETVLYLISLSACHAHHSSMFPHLQRHWTSQPHIAAGSVVCICSSCWDRWPYMPLGVLRPHVHEWCGEGTYTAPCGPY